MKKEKKKSSLAKRIFLAIISVIILLVVLLVIWAAWGKNLGQQVEYTSYHVTDAAFTNKENIATVYMTTDISPEGIMAIYDTLGVQPTGNVAVKLSTGEAGGNYYLSPKLIEELVQSVNGTIVECNTAYGGSRASTLSHMQVAQDHGFTKIAGVDIMDANGSLSIPVVGGEHLSENLVGENLANYDFVMVLSHFKGHQMAGFGGALKNISIGIASQEGKGFIHSAGMSSNFMFGMALAQQNAFVESMAEAAKSVSDYFNSGENMIYINVLNHISVDCDCVSNPAEPEIHDIGIVASTDPVTIDQACIDLIYGEPNSEELVERIESRNGLLILQYAEKIGLGKRAYQLISID